MPLTAAAGQYRTEDGAPQRACEWYRKDAHRPGTVSIGGMPVIGICPDGHAVVPPATSLSPGIAEGSGRDGVPRIRRRRDPHGCVLLGSGAGVVVSRAARMAAMSVWMEPPAKARESRARRAAAAFP
jgi:hypothetical protein